MPLNNCLPETNSNPQSSFPLQVKLERIQNERRCYHVYSFSPIPNGELPFVDRQRPGDFIIPIFRNKTAFKMKEDFIT